MAAQVHNQGLKVGDEVLVMKKHAAADAVSDMETQIGVLEKVEEDQCLVRFPEPVGVLALKPDNLRKANKQDIKESKRIATEAKKRKLVDDDVVLPSGIAYDLSSASQTSSAVISWVRASLWKVVVSSGAGSSTADFKQGLILKEQGDDEELPACVAASDFEPMQICIVPFGAVKEAATKKEQKFGLAIPITATFEPQG